MAGEARKWSGDKEATVYIGNLDEKVTDAIVYELCLQVGRVVSVHLPRDRVTQTHQGYGFVDFREEMDAEYACKILNGVKLYGKAIRMNKATADKNKTIEVGAELFVGNLDPFVSEEALYQTFNKFGDFVTNPKVARDTDGNSKGYGFVNFTDFEAADKAIEAMNNQFLFNRTITVQYAYKKDGKGDRHGDEAERALARNAREHGVTLDAWKPEMAAARPTAIQSAGPPISLTANGFQSQPDQFNQPPQGQFMAQPPPTPQGFGQFPPGPMYGQGFPPQHMQMPPQSYGYGYPPGPGGPMYGMQQSPPGFNGPPGQAPPAFGAPPGHAPPGFGAPPGQAAPGFGQSPPGFGNPPGFPPQQTYGRR